MAANQPVIEPLDWCSEILTIERSAQLFPWSEDTLKSCFSDSYANVGYWSETAELMGFALVQTIGDSWTIMNIVTKRSAQRQGIARQLLRHIQLSASAQQAHILLEVRVSNSAALALYQRCGFSTIGRRKDYYPSADNSREDALVMSWSAG